MEEDHLEHLAGYQQSIRPFEKQHHHYSYRQPTNCLRKTLRWFRGRSRFSRYVVESRQRGNRWSFCYGSSLGVNHEGRVGKSENKWKLIEGDGCCNRKLIARIVYSAGSPGVLATGESWDRDIDYLFYSRYIHVGGPVKGQYAVELSTFGVRLESIG